MKVKMASETGKLLTAAFGVMVCTPMPVEAETDKPAQFTVVTGVSGSGEVLFSQPYLFDPK